MAAPRRGGLAVNRLVVIRPGVFTTVQDLGRPGYAHLGVPRGGAADTLSLRIANRLLGNDESDAAIECTVHGPRFSVDADTLLCLAGADTAEATVSKAGGGEPIATWQPTPVAAGTEIDIGPMAPGCRTLLAIAGGVRTQPVLGSRSMHVTSGIACDGEPLREGDTIPIGSIGPGLHVPALPSELRTRIQASLLSEPLRLVPAAHTERFDDHALRSLTRQRFTVESRSDRTGVRLRGVHADPPLIDGLESEGVVPGSVQIPPSGAPIVLGVDGPTTGGYPVIATVIEADLHALAQRRPGDTITFSWTDLANAARAKKAIGTLVNAVPSPGASAHYSRERGG